MFKFVALCALLAVAAAEPGLISAPAYSYGSYLSSPYYAAPALAPATYAAPLAYSAGYAPVAYSAPLGHLIKKRSAPALAVNSYIAPAYTAAASYAAPYYSTGPAFYSAASPYYPATSPYYPAASIYSSPYLIKK